MIQYLLNDPLKIPSHWGLRASTYEFQGGPNIQFIAHALGSMRDYQRLSLYNSQNQGTLSLVVWFMVKRQTWGSWFRFGQRWRRWLETGSHSVQGGTGPHGATDASIRVTLVFGQRHQEMNSLWEGRREFPPHFFHFCWRTEFLRLCLTQCTCVQTARVFTNTFTPNRRWQSTGSEPGPALGTFSSTTLSFPSLWG